MNEYHELLKSSKNNIKNDINNPLMNQPVAIEEEESTSTLFVDEQEMKEMKLIRSKEDNNILTFVDDEQYIESPSHPKTIVTLQDMVTYQQLKEQVQQEQQQEEEKVNKIKSYTYDDELSINNIQILNQEKDVFDDVNTMLTLEEDDVVVTTTMVQIDDADTASTLLLNEGRFIESNEKSIDLQNIVTEDAIMEEKAVDLVVEDIVDFF